ncbi:retrovirus-related pol polyprotein from transposon TNT 1-94 [Tanacetum coccineum]
MAVTPLNKDKRVRFADPITSSSNDPKQTNSLKSQDSNKPLLHPTGVNSTTSASGSKPSGNTKKNRISRPSSSNKKNKVEEHSRSIKFRKKKMNRVDKTECNAHDIQSVLNANSISEPIFGNRCPLTRIASELVPPKESTIAPVITSYHKVVQIVLWYLDSGCSKHMTGNRSQLQARSIPICLLSKSSKTKSWLWHHRLSHLNFGTLNKLAKDGLTRGIPKLKFQKDHLCSACALGKSKKSSHQPKAEDTNQEKLYLLHMDMYGLMRMESINGKKYILVIVDDYSRFTWVRFLRSKDEAPEAIIKCIKNIQVRINATVRRIFTIVGNRYPLTRITSELVPPKESTIALVITSDLKVYSRRPKTLGSIGSSSKTTIVESLTSNTKKPNQSWGSTISDTSSSLIDDSLLPDLSFLHVFGSLCYPTNDSEDLEILDAKADIGIFVGYTRAKNAFRIYNRRTQKIMETIHVSFDELTAMASEQFGLGLRLQSMTPATSSSGLVSNPIPQQPCNTPKRDDWDILFQPMFDEYFNPPTNADSPVPVVAAPRAIDLADSPMSTSIDQDSPSTKSQKTPLFHDDPLLESTHEDSTSHGSLSNMRPIHTPFKHLGRWTKDHPIANVIGDPSRSVSTRKQLKTDAL